MVLIHRLVVLGFGLGVTSIAPTSAGMVEVYELIGYDMGEKREHASESTSQARSPFQGKRKGRPYHYAQKCSFTMPIASYEASSQTMQ